jgi:chromosomal replication initiation ATPase DnaA
MNIPRHQQHPIDTSIVVRMAKYNNNYSKPAIKAPIEKIRQAIIDVTGYDPYCEPANRLKEFVQARQLFLFFVRHYIKLSQASVGLIIGKDHATVNYAEKCVKRFRLLEPAYAMTFKKLDEIINPIFSNN